MNIFIIEDDIVLRDELSKLLISYGYDCSFLDSNFEHVAKKVIDASPDLLLLDVNLPSVDGYHICREIRKCSDLPIIIVTSRSTDMDELMGINLGADDFITKPYNKQILLARIESVLKRCNMSTNLLNYKGLYLCLDKSTISINDNTEDLTKNELRILSILIRNAGRIVSRDELMEELWQSDEFIDDNTLTVNVNRLRHKLETIGAKSFITTKRGQGYLI